MTPRERAAEAVHDTLGSAAEDVVDAALTAVGLDAVADKLNSVQEVAVAAIRERDAIKAELYVTAPGEALARAVMGLLDDLTAMVNAVTDSSRQVVELRGERDRYKGALERVALEPAPGSTTACRRVARAALQPDPAAGDGLDTECGSCGDPDAPTCPGSKRACGHHCNCVWTHGACDWCSAHTDEDGTFVEDGDGGMA